jgi:hypothetical protein
LEFEETDQIFFKFHILLNRIILVRVKLNNLNISPFGVVDIALSQFNESSLARPSLNRVEEIVVAYIGILEASIDNPVRISFCDTTLRE